jgi:hypothetical protein
MPTQAVAQYILPNTIIKTILKAKAPRGQSNPAVHLTLADGKVSARLPDGTEALAGLVEGAYPNYLRICPRDIGETAPATINPTYALDAYEALNDYRRVPRTTMPCVGFALRGKAVAVLAYAGFIALIEPLNREIVPICSDLTPLEAFVSPSKAS